MTKVIVKEKAVSTAPAAGAALTKPTLKEVAPAVETPVIPSLEIIQEAPVVTAPAKRFFPVRILKGYRPAGDFVMRPRDDPENEFSPRIEREPTADERLKIRAGLYAGLELEEAKKIIKLGIAERDDPLELH
jgi:hypothetical protein